jgi:hypothetical protein
MRRGRRSRGRRRRLWWWWCVGGDGGGGVGGGGGGGDVMVWWWWGWCSVREAGVWGCLGESVVGFLLILFVSSLLLK